MSVPVPELHETVTTTARPDGGWTWAFQPPTDRYFGFVTHATDDAFCR